MVDGRAPKLGLQKCVRRVSRIAGWAGRRVSAVALQQLPHYSRWGVYSQAVFITAVLVWFEYRPGWAVQGPGVAMGFLAVAAMYLTFRGPSSTPERVVWIIVSFCLFALEIHSIELDRKRRDLQQAQLLRTEESTRENQTQAFAHLIGNGERLLRSLAQETDLTKTTLQDITGGNEYCWLVPLSPMPVDWGGDATHQGNNWWQLALKNSGTVVLPTCEATFTALPDREEREAGAVPSPPVIYHFDKVPAMDSRTYRYTRYFVKGGGIYTGRIETPTRSFVETISFEVDPRNSKRYVPHCKVAELSGKVLQTECYPQ